MKQKYGVHCTSTAIMNYLLNNNIILSEEMIFGIGQGLGFTFFIYEDIKYPYASGRSSSLIENFFYNIGVELEKRQRCNFDFFLNDLNQSKYVICKFDWNFLPHIVNALKLNKYYPFSEHHTLVVANSTKDGNLNLIDHLWPPIKISYDQFKKAWVSETTKPFSICGEYYFVPEEISVIDISKQTIINAIRANMWEFLFPYNPLNDYCGLKGLKKFFNYFCSILENIENSEEIFTLSQFLYLSLERIGTGGGCFRRMYGRFLYECGIKFGISLLEKIATEYLELSKIWKKFCSFLITNNIFKNETETKVIFKKIIGEEERLALKLLDFVNCL